MERSITEVLASQKRMLVRRGEDPNKIGDDQLASLFEKHVEEVFHWIEAQPAMETLIINYNQLIKDPEPQIETIDTFLDQPLDTQKMAAIVDPKLYRQRS